MTWVLLALLAALDVFFAAIGVVFCSCFVIGWKGWLTTKGDAAGMMRP